MLNKFPAKQRHNSELERRLYARCGMCYGFVSVCYEPEFYDNGWTDQGGYSLTFVVAALLRRSYNLYRSYDTPYSRSTLNTAGFDNWLQWISLIDDVWSFEFGNRYSIIDNSSRISDFTQFTMNCTRYATLYVCAHSAVLQMDVPEGLKLTVWWHSVSEILSTARTIRVCRDDGNHKRRPAPAAVGWRRWRYRCQLWDRLSLTTTALATAYLYW